MRKFLTVLYCVVVFVFLFGEARSVHVLSDATMFETHALAKDHEAVCGYGSAHAACQLVLGNQGTLLILTIVLAPSRFEIVSVRASSRSSSPHPPPPRYIS